MNSLSLQPRYDLFRFTLPKTFFAQSLIDKYNALLTRENSVLYDVVDYVNESIVQVKCLGINELLVQQSQTSIDLNVPHKLRRATSHELSYGHADASPLENLNRTLTIDFRLNQGMYNYFILYETLFDKFLRNEHKTYDDMFEMQLMDERGNVCVQLRFYDVYISGIDGLEFDFNRIDRENNTFSITFEYNDIDVTFFPSMHDIFDKTKRTRGEHLKPTQ